MLIGYFYTDSKYDTTTVQGVLAARIDRLTPEEKALLQQLSVIGRQFPVSLIKQIVPQSEANLHRLLASLQTKEYLYEQPALPESDYIFKHALTQEVAYGTVLQEQRKASHARTGEALEGLYCLSLRDHYSELAHHYNHSNNAAKAAEYQGLAGHQAVRRSANEDAVQHFTTALERLRTLPDSRERNQQELMLQLALGVPLAVTGGYSSPEMGNAYMRAQALCEQIGDTPELFPTLYGLWLFYYVRAEHKKARELGEQLLRLAETRQDSSLLLEADYAMGNCLFCLGEPAAALARVEHGIVLYEPKRHHALAFSYGSYDPGVGCLCYTSMSLWLLGYPEQAQKTSHD